MIAIYHSTYVFNATTKHVPVFSNLGALVLAQTVSRQNFVQAMANLQSRTWSNMIMSEVQSVWFWITIDFMHMTSDARAGDVLIFYFSPCKANMHRCKNHQQATFGDSSTQICYLCHLFFVLYDKVKIVKIWIPKIFYCIYNEELL